MEDEIVSEGVLIQAEEELEKRESSHVERLAKVLCILLGGVIDTLLKEYNNEPESDEG